MAGWSLIVAASVGREEDGVDSASFYDDVEIVDTFINEYRNVLRRLARR